MVYGTKTTMAAWFNSSAGCSLSWMIFYEFNLCLWPVGNVFAWTVGDAEGCWVLLGAGGLDTGTQCAVRNLLPPGLGLCPCSLLAVPGCGAWLCRVLWLLSALCPEGWARSSCASPGIVCEPWNAFALPCSLQQGLLLKECWIGDMSTVPGFVQAGVLGCWKS